MTTIITGIFAFILGSLFGILMIAICSCNKNDNDYILILNASEAATYLGLSIESIDSMSNDGKLSYFIYKDGDKEDRYYKKDDLDIIISKYK